MRRTLALLIVLSLALAVAPDYGELRVEVFIEGAEKEVCRGDTASITSTVRNLLRGNLPFVTNVTGPAARFVVTPAYTWNLGHDMESQFVFNFEIDVDAEPGTYPYLVISVPRDGAISGEAQGKIIVKECVIPTAGDTGSETDSGTSDGPGSTTDTGGPARPPEEGPLIDVSTAIIAALCLLVITAAGLFLYTQRETEPTEDIPQRYDYSYQYFQGGNPSFYASRRAGDTTGYSGYYNPPGPGY